MDPKIASQVLSNLDGTANKIEALAKRGLISKKAAEDIVQKIDGFADKFQTMAFGEDNLRNHQAKVLKQDSDEPYMKTFDNVNEPLKTDSDEPYMHKVDKSFNSDAIDTYDQDRSSTVTDRKEHDVRDISEHANGTKPQPSWTGGKGGKSTHQGSSSARQGKTWA